MIYFCQSPRFESPYFCQSPRCQSPRFEASRSYRKAQPERRFNFCNALFILIRSGFRTAVPFRSAVCQVLTLQLYRLKSPDDSCVSNLGFLPFDLQPNLKATLPSPFHYIDPFQQIQAYIVGSKTLLFLEQQWEQNNVCSVVVYFTKKAV